MPASGGNVAYDLSIYETKRKEKKPEPERKPVKHVNSSKAMRLKRIKHTSSLKMSDAFNTLSRRTTKIITMSVVAALVVGAFFGISLFYMSVENELADAIDNSEAKLTTLKNDYDGLMVQYDTRMSDTAIEEYAEKKLGMQKRENYQLEWITVGDQDDFDNDDVQNGSVAEKISSYFD